MQQTARGERLTIIVLAILSAVLRAAAFFHYRFDSDESQHLHVAWGWTAGLLQYRDVFDNHAPLFHMATAPILAAVGERETVLLWMRAPMLLLFAAVIIATYVLAQRLYSRRVGVWSAVLLSLLPAFFLKSLEYRTDNQWNALWYIALVILTGGPLTSARIFVTAFILGCTLATSMKTTLLILTLVVAAAALRIIAGVPIRVTWSQAVAAVAGLFIVPLGVVLYFYARGGLPSLLYCVIHFNTFLAATKSPLALWLPRLAWVLGMIVLVRFARRSRPNDDDLQSRWRFFFGVAIPFFILTLAGFWILISPRDLLPVLPLMVIFGVAFVDRHLRRPILVYAGAAVLFVALIVHYTDGFANHTREYTTMMHQTLRLSRPGEPIMDLKGETIYRPRPFYYIFEYITRNAMRAGLIADTIPEDLIRTQCHIAQADGEFFPPRGRAFLNANFMDMGRLRATGKWIQVNDSFTIAVPGPYVVITRKGQAAGVLDGVPYQGTRVLAAGEHRFESTLHGQPVAVLWARAYERGFSPFHPQDREF